MSIPGCALLLNELLLFSIFPFHALFKDLHCSMYTDDCNDLVLQALSISSIWSDYDAILIPAQYQIVIIITLSSSHVCLHLSLRCRSQCQNEPKPSSFIRFLSLCSSAFSTPWHLYAVWSHLSAPHIPYLIYHISQEAFPTRPLCDSVPEL